MENPCIGCKNIKTICEDCIEKDTCDRENSCKYCNCSLLEEYLEED